MQLNKIKTEENIKREFETKKKRNKKLKIEDIDDTFMINIPLSIVRPLRIIFEWIYNLQIAAMKKKQDDDEEEESWNEAYSSSFVQ